MVGLGVITIPVFIGLALVPLGGFFIWAGMEGEKAMKLLRSSTSF